MIVKQLIEKLKEFEFDQEDACVICMDESGGWDNIEDVYYDGTTVNIIFGGGSPFPSDN